MNRLPAMPQDQIEIMVGAKGVIPGQPVHEHEWLLIQKWPNLRQLLLICREHACVLMTPFGRPVEPDVNRNFAIVLARIAVAHLSKLRRVDGGASIEEVHATQVGAVAICQDLR